VTISPGIRALRTTSIGRQARAPAALFPDGEVTHATRLPRYDYFDHDADTGVIGPRASPCRTRSCTAAEATVSRCMCDPITVAQDERIDVEFESRTRTRTRHLLNLLLAHANEPALPSAASNWPRTPSLARPKRLG